MSRDRYDRDDEEPPYGRRRRNDDSFTYQRDDYGRPRYSRDREYDYDDPSSRDRTRPVGGGRDYGRDEDYGYSRYGERPEYRFDERRYRDEADYRQRARSRWDDVRDSAREAFGGRPERRGASRSHVRCRDIMTRDVTCAMRGSTLQEVASMMRDEDTGVIPVVEPGDEPLNIQNAGDGSSRRMGNRMYSNGRLVGLITDRDIVVRAIADGRSVATRAEEIMTGDIHTARPNDRVIDVIRKMGDKQVRRIPVVDDNDNLVGIISMADVALETENDRELADALEEISSGSSFWSKIFG
jgi:CBS domain-containing protein